MAGMAEKLDARITFLDAEITRVLAEAQRQRTELQATKATLVAAKTMLTNNPGAETLLLELKKAGVL